jgi:hypothetical protein
MKKLSMLFLLVIFFSTGFVTKVSAQWTDLVWETYGIGFKAPSDFTLTENDHNAFTANGAIFTMSIKPWKDASITDPMKICQHALDITPGSDKKVILEQEIKHMNGLNGYEGYCTATQDGKFLHILVGGYLNPSNSTNFTVQLLFWDNEEHNKTNIDAAIYILESFHVL